MATRFVNIDRDTPMLLPPDLRDWVPRDHVAHFVIDAVEALDLQQVTANTRGTGDAQYPPTMLLRFRQFLLRGAENVSTEWSLVCLAYNLRRLHTLGTGKKLSSVGIKPGGGAGQTQIPVRQLDSGGPARSAN